MILRINQHLKLLLSVRMISRIWIWVMKAEPLHSMLKEIRILVIISIQMDMFLFNMKKNVLRNQREMLLINTPLLYCLMNTNMNLKEKFAMDQN